MNYKYRRVDIPKKIMQESDEFLKVFSDRDIKIILLWALVGPFCALGYIIWKKYPHMRWVALLCFAVNIIYLTGQIGGWLYLQSFLSS